METTSNTTTTADHHQLRSPPVEAVISFGYEAVLVQSVYQELINTAGFESGEGAARSSNRVSATTLMKEVDRILQQCSEQPSQQSSNSEANRAASPSTQNDNVEQSEATTTTTASNPPPVARNSALLLRLKALRAENKRLKSRQFCRKCKEKPVALTLLPCGHFALCVDCGPGTPQCPVCKKAILADVKTFVS